MGYNHIGDIDIVDGIIYGGLEGGSTGALAKWRTDDLSMITFTITNMPDMPWVAIEPTTKRLYSAIWNDCCAFQMFDSESFNYLGEYRMPEGVTLPGVRVFSFI